MDNDIQGLEGFENVDDPTAILERAAALLANELDRQTEQLEHAFQPIVNIHTGAVFGFEALLRGCDRIGFTSPMDFFDSIAERGLLERLERSLLTKVLDSFRKVIDGNQIKLFQNLDPRLFEQLDTRPAAGRLTFDGHVLDRLDRHGLHPGLLCIEVTERTRLIESRYQTEGILGSLRRNLAQLVLDDFGTGFSGLQILYEIEPEFIKIDRFFIQNIAQDHKKRLFVSNIVNIAHTLGIRVIAEGIESKLEFFVCRDVGCDLAQGYLIQRPTSALDDLLPQYDVVAQMAASDMRTANRSDSDLITPRVVEIPAISAQTPMVAVLEHFRKHPEHSFFPVLNKAEEPVGIIREADLKEIVYSPDARLLVEDPDYSKDLSDFLVKVPVVDLESKAERILDLFTLLEYPDAVIVVRNMRYAGVLTATSLLRIIHDKDLTQARDQSPLTRLPGSYMVQRYLQEAARDARQDYIIVYLDFDNFKPFNDLYGFRYGDRAICMFADLLRKQLAGKECFIGHIGGDDFLLGFCNEPHTDTETVVTGLCRQFRHEAESLYNPEIREQGHIEAKDRFGEMRRFPLLSVSAALLRWPASEDPRSVEELSIRSATIKKQAKESESKIAWD